MRAFVAAHRLLVAIGAILVAGLAAFVLLYFEPQTLFIDHHVDEPLPTAVAGKNRGARERDAQTGSKPSLAVLATGAFHSYEHSTSGRARILRLADGSRYLRFDHFETSNGPDVRVYLSAAAAGGPGDEFDDDHVELGGLKGNIGDQNYAIPADVRLGRFESAVVWCKRFSVAFGAASLE